MLELIKEAILFTSVILFISQYVCVYVSSNRFFCVCVYVSFVSVSYRYVFVFPIIGGQPIRKWLLSVRLFVSLFTCFCAYLSMRLIGWRGGRRIWLLCLIMDEEQREKKLRRTIISKNTNGVFWAEDSLSNKRRQNARIITRDKNKRRNPSEAEKQDDNFFFL